MSNASSLQLTTRVLEYKNSRDSRTMKDILTLTHSLVYRIFQRYTSYYDMPKDIREHILTEGSTSVLLKCIDSFDQSKGTQFSTHYVWWLRSYFNDRREFYERRVKVLKTISIEELTEDELEVRMSSWKSRTNTGNRLQKLFQGD